MANLKASIKDIRKTKKRTARNKHVVTGVKSSIKKAHSTKDTNSCALAYKKIDSAATSGKIHKNKANRLKSRLMKQINRNSKTNNETTNK